MAPIGSGPGLALKRKGDGLVKDRPAKDYPTETTYRAKHPSSTNAGPGTVVSFPRKRLTLRRYASWRLGDILALCRYRWEQDGYCNDPDTIAWALAVTLGVADRSPMLLGRHARVWPGLDHLTLREHVVKAGLGHLTDDRLSDIMQGVVDGWAKYGRKPVSPTRMGHCLQLTGAERRACKIKTIDAIDESKAERRAKAVDKKRERNREADRRRRAAQGAKPQAHSKARLKPWEALGMSKPTFYRKGLHKAPQTT
jgi:hypothetical protein